jgi:SAM-dependent methyltransferase
MKNLTEKGIVNLEQDETLTNKELLLGWHDQVKLSSNSKWNRYCVVCGSPYVAYVRHVTNISLKKDLALFHCMECKSFVNPSGYIPDERAHESELLFHIKVEERNNQRSEWLFDYLMEAYPTVSSILEIGCGTGTLIKVAKERGYGAVGFDINKPAIEYGRKKFNVDLRAKFWTTESKVKFNMIICIMVLEHLEDPRPCLTKWQTLRKKEKLSFL